jgi:heterotetrameric sarcosine oxidase gamma subunit
MARLAISVEAPVDIPGVSRCRDLAIFGIARVGRQGDSLPVLPGLAADAAAGTVTRAGGLLLLVLAPGEWLVLGEVAEAARHLEQGSGFLVADLRHGRTVYRLAPGAARSALAANSPLDPAHDLPGGRCAQTLFGDAGVLLVPEPDGDLLMIGDAALDTYILALLSRTLGN